MMTKEQILEEIWKPVHIPLFEHYEVSNKGNLRRREYSFIRKNGKKQTFKPYTPKFDVVHGYNQVWLMNGSDKVRQKVHRLVAFAFIPIVPGKPFINHKNSIRNDNRVENLEWVTHAENMKHKFKQGYKPPKRIKKLYAENPNSKAVVQLTLDGVFVQEFDCIKAAAESGGFSSICIGLACKDKIRWSGGFKWKFKKDYI